MTIEDTTTDGGALQRLGEEAFVASQIKKAEEGLVSKSEALRETIKSVLVDDLEHHIIPSCIK